MKMAAASPKSPEPHSSQKVILSTLFLGLMLALINERGRIIDLTKHNYKRGKEILNKSLGDSE